jgi:PAS domain S-box-containing protein
VDGKTLAAESKDREDRYRRIVEAHTDPICRFLPDGTLTFVNAAYCEYFGEPEEELIRGGFFRYMSDAQRSEVRGRLQSITRGDPVFTHEHEIAVAPGDPRWIKWTVRGIFDEEDEPGEFQSVARDVTARKQAEIALKKSEARYANLIQAIPDGVVAYDPEGQATYANDGFVHLYGWRLDEVIGKTIDFVPGDEMKSTQVAWERTFEGENVFFETRRRTKRGNVRDIQLRTAILRDAEGNITESLVIHRDITERKKSEEALRKAHDELERRVAERTGELAETNEQLRREMVERENAQQRLRESEARHRMLVENAPLGIIWCDAKGKILQVNSNLLAILGLPASEENKAVNVLTHPPLVEAGISREFRRCLETGGTRVFECFHTSERGKSAWLRLHMVPTREPRGSVNGVQALLEDITDRKRAETDLSESEERLRAVFETARDAIFLKDRDLVYTHVNPAFLNAMGVSESQAVGKTDDEIIGPQEAGYIKDLERRVLDGQVMEATYNLTTGESSKTFHCVRVPMHGPSGETIGVCGIARDITERKALERRRPRSSGRYRSTIMESTLEQIRLAARSETIVLLLGESGSGKDYFSRYLHDHSRRSGGPYFAINCAALAPAMAESELFGHEAGSFTGSLGRKRGLLELAEGGTLLLNEIGELPQELQAKLLTFLDTQSFTRVGGEKTVQVNAGIVGATNRNLEREVAAGRFREDLYYRLNVFSVRVPSLRERTDDIPLLARDILESLSVKMGRSRPPVLHVSALEAFSRYHWPGNVRELRNVLERALILCRGDVIRVDDINLPKAGSNGFKDDGEISASVTVSGKSNLNLALEQAKRLMIVGALRRSKGNVSAAARFLGISRDALRHHMKMLDLERGQYPQTDTR